MYLEYKIKQIYGQNMMYPVNDAARTITDLTGRKTLSNKDLILAEKLGLIIKQVI